MLQAGEAFMLYLGDKLYNRIVSIPIICTMIGPNNNLGDNELQDFFRHIKSAAIHSFVDTIFVGGITFFSSLAAIGYNDLIVNIKIAFFSSVVTAGLSFFTEMKNRLNITNRAKNNNERTTKNNSFSAKE